MSTKMNRTLFPLLTLLGVMLLLALGPGAGRAAAADDTWVARYFNNRTLAGNPIVQRPEEAINNDWGGGRPHALVNDDNFSVRWTRNVDFSAGNYRFTATMDDGMRVWIDDQLLIDAWTDSQVRTLQADRVLSGEHSVRVEYFEAGGMAVAKFSWQQIGATPPGTFANWKGEYYNNMNLTGQPSFLRDDREINFNWSTGSPAAGIAADQFSVRWTRSLNFPVGNYRFDVFADDGVRLWVNNVLVVDQWRNQSEGRFSANVSLNGATSLRMEYFEDVGRAAVALSWNPPGGSPITGGTGGTGVIGVGPWLGEYYNNMNFIGAPTFTRNDAAIDFNWGEGSPGAGIPVDRFAVRWTRTVPLTAGLYRFDVFSDDGIRVWVNNQIIFDQWRDQPAGNFSATISLPAGNIPIRVEYFENTGRAAVALSTTPPLPTGGTTVTPPISGLTATVTGTGGARLNIRSLPGGPLTGQQLQPNQTVGLTGFRSADSGWVEIFRPAGGTGWVSARYVTTSIPVASLSVR